MFSEKLIFFLKSILDIMLPLNPCQLVRRGSIELKFFQDPFFDMSFRIFFSLVIFSDGATQHINRKNCFKISNINQITKYEQIYAYGNTKLNYFTTKILVVK